MDLGFAHLIKDRNMKANGKMIKLMEKEHIILKADRNTQVILKTSNIMEKDVTFLKMGKNLMANG